METETVPPPIRYQCPKCIKRGIKPDIKDHMRTHHNEHIALGSPQWKELEVKGGKS